MMDSVKKRSYSSDKGLVIVWEYRGHEYEVEYDAATISLTPAWLQHRNAKESIDEQIERESKKPAVEEDHEPFDASVIWELLGWD